MTSRDATSAAAPTPARLRAVFFDLDDTLIGYEEAERAALTASCLRAAELRPEIRPLDLAHAVYAAYKSGFAYGTPGFQELAHLSVADFRRRLTVTALRRQEVPAEEPLVEALLAAYESAEKESLRAFPEAAETLIRLKAHFQLGVITNGPSALQRRKLRVLGLEDLFDTIVVDTEFGHSKPDPRIFAHAAGRLGLAPKELLFVGNSLAYDVTGARRAGWASVWMNPSARPLPAHFQTPNASTPDYVVRHLSDLLSLPPIACSLPFHALGSPVSCPAAAAQPSRSV